jgi:hypothetical protein
MPVITRSNRKLIDKLTEDILNDDIIRNKMMEFHQTLIDNNDPDIEAKMEALFLYIYLMKKGDVKSIGLIEKAVSS